MNGDFSVVIPLYNKEREVGAAIRSVLAQRLLPREIIVVDDGSTDGSAAVVEAILREQAETRTQEAAEKPPVRLVRQANGGVCAARNRGIAEATGAYIALLDADDSWETGFLAEIAALITEWPGCGLYCTAFDIVSSEGRFPAPTPAKRGIIEHFFGESAHRYIAIPSAAVIPRAVFGTTGGFPEGMKLGEDQWMWFQIARRHKVCFSPERLVRYSRIADNRSTATYTPERTAHSFEALYDPEAPDEQNEFVARIALARALTISVRGGTAEAARAARFFAYTRVYRRTLRKVRLLNALPISWRQPLLKGYNALAWRIAKKGL